MENEKTTNAPGSIYTLAAKLWIVDCLRIPPHPAVENAYLFNSFVVHYVDVFGVVTSRRIIGASRAVYTIDDGTGEILCLFDSARRDIEEDYEQIKGITSELENASGCTEDEHKLLKYMMKPAINTFENLVQFRELGDTVHVVGRLCQYRELRQVKAYHMRLVTDLNDEVDRIHELVLLYENGYCKSKG
jgi:DNA/RNA endonuclease YhcR with UshA esterase domain